MTEKAYGPRAASDDLFRERIIRIHAMSNGAYGAPRVFGILREQGYTIGENRVARLMSLEGLSGATCSKRAANPTVYPPDRNNRNFGELAIRRSLVGDTTQLKVIGGNLYLAMLMDVCSRRVLGWGISDHNNTALVLAALKMAVREGPFAARCKHHTDRGSTYIAGEYQAAVTGYGFLPSMGEVGECHDNPLPEAWFARMKCELRVKGSRLKRFDETRALIVRYIETYNATRLHTALGMSPRQFERLPREAQARIARRAARAKQARHEARARRIAQARRKRAARRKRGTR